MEYENTNDKFDFHLTYLSIDDESDEEKISYADDDNMESTSATFAMIILFIIFYIFIIVVLLLACRDLQ